jgi:hypothetical protein
MSPLLKTVPVRRLLAAAVILLAALQLVPVARTNPPVEGEVPADASARDALRRACYDCHSNETAWPWYSRVAPVSFFVARDVNLGREELNYSTWNRLAPREQAKMLKKSWEEVAEGEMPPWFYVPLHRGAALSPRDREALRAWSQAEGAATLSRAGTAEPMGGAEEADDD